MEKKKFVVVTDKGIMGSKGLSGRDVMAELLYAFLHVWCEEVCPVDIGEAGKAVVDLLDSMCDEEEDEDEDEDDLLADIMKMLLEDDDE